MCKFRCDMEDIVMQTCNCCDFGIIIISDAHILMKRLITLSQTFQPTKGWFNWAEIGAVRRKVDNFFAARKDLLASPVEIEVDMHIP
jgi:hypothetical protein